MLLDRMVNREAQIVAYVDDYVLLIVTTLPSLLLLLLMQDAARRQAHRRRRPGDGAVHSAEGPRDPARLDGAIGIVRWITKS